MLVYSIFLIRHNDPNKNKYTPENAGVVRIITGDEKLEVEETIHIVPGKHMSPHVRAEQIVDIVYKALNI